MSFVLSKVFWALTQPSNVLLLALLIAATLVGKKPVLARRLLRITVLVLLLVTLLPIGQWLILPMERRFPELAELPAKVDGIVVLGGGVDVEPSIGRDHLELNDAAERVTVSAEIARQRPDAKLIYSGFKGRLVDVSDEMPDIARFYARNGVEPTRVLIEDQSRNTYENALLSKGLADPAPGDVWLLVTSASHMPRALGVFRKIGWPVVAMPVDFRRPVRLEPRSYLSIIAQPHVSDRLGELDHAVKTWVGLVAYWLMGRTSALFPKP